jgi:hypothetical protein
MATLYVPDHGRELDGFRAGAEDEQQAFHEISSLKRFSPQTRRR